MFSVFLYYAKKCLPTVSAHRTKRIKTITGAVQCLWMHRDLRCRDTVTSDYDIIVRMWYHDLKHHRASGPAYVYISHDYIYKEWWMYGKQIN